MNKSTRTINFFFKNYVKKLSIKQHWLKLKDV